MNLNRKAYGERTSVISSLAIDSSTLARRTDSYPLATGYCPLLNKISPHRHREHEVKIRSGLAPSG